MCTFPERFQSGVAVERHAPGRIAGPQGRRFDGNDPGDHRAVRTDIGKRLVRPGFFNCLQTLRGAATVNGIAAGAQGRLFNFWFFCFHVTTPYWNNIDILDFVFVYFNFFFFLHTYILQMKIIVIYDLLVKIYFVHNSTKKRKKKKRTTTTKHTKKKTKCEIYRIPLIYTRFWKSIFW